MKKVLAIVLVLVMVISFAACKSEPKIEDLPASEEDKQLVIDIANEFLTSEEFINYVHIYEDQIEPVSFRPEITSAYRFKCDMAGVMENQPEYFADMVLFNVKVTAAYFNEEGEWCGLDKMQFIYDVNTGSIYDSITYSKEMNTFTGEYKDEKDIFVGFLNSGVLNQDGDSILWSETEESFRFAGENLVEINEALDCEYITDKVVEEE